MPTAKTEVDISAFVYRSFPVFRAASGLGAACDTLPDVTCAMLSASRCPERMEVVVHTRVSLSLVSSVLRDLCWCPLRISGVQEVQDCPDVAWSFFSTSTKISAVTQSFCQSFSLKKQTCYLYLGDASVPLPDQPLKEVSGSAQSACQYWRQ